VIVVRRRSRGSSWRTVPIVQARPVRRGRIEDRAPAPARLFSSVDRQITLSFVHDHPTPAIASRVKTTRMGGFLTRHHYTGRVPAQVLAERMRANLPPARPAPSPARASPPRHVPGELVFDRVHAAGARGVRGVETRR
jgi:hypothetical protein